MGEERIDFFDENYQRLGTTTKPEARANGWWVHSFHCWILRTSGEPALYLQKRSTTKALFPDFLDISAAGHLQAGEKPIDGLREVFEEVGLNVDPKDLISLGVKFDIAKLRNITNRQFCHVYLLPTTARMADMTLDKGELDGMVEMNVSDGLALFSGQTQSVRTKGVEKTPQGNWNPVEADTGTSAFIPRVDPYYYKMFIIADLFMKGYKHLSI